MEKVERIRTFDQIKALADSHRLQILRLLMSKPATLSQLAAQLNHSPAWIRHHIQRLQDAGLVHLASVRTAGRITEKYYRAAADAFMLQDFILPRSRKPAIVISGSHDLALDGTAARLSKHVTLLTMPVGSLDGLMHLRLGLCQLAGAHIPHANGEYNVPTVRHLFPDRAVMIVTLAHRTQGLMFRPGNPKSVKDLADLARPGLRFVNRNAGSGTRLWLDAELSRRRVDPARIAGYERASKTHTEAAALVATGKADSTLGLQAAARQHGLGFIPLFEERYDLVVPEESQQALSPLLQHIQSAAFRGDLKALTGYGTAQTGRQVSL